MRGQRIDASSLCLPAQTLQHIHTLGRLQAIACASLGLFPGAGDRFDAAPEEIGAIRRQPAAGARDERQQSQCQRSLYQSLDPGPFEISSASGPWSSNATLRNGATSSRVKGASS